VDHYSTEPEKFKDPAGMITVGVFVHEFGHQLGLPDLYDIDYSSNGIGVFCVMSAGSWGRASTSDPPGSSPVHFCAWSKYQLGWVTPIAVERWGVKEIKSAPLPAAATDTACYRMLEDPGGPDWQETGGGTGEYFLIENRYRTGFDRGLPGNGLLICHVDDSRPDNHDDDHPVVGIMQADHDPSPSLPTSDRGTEADLWKNSSYGLGDTSRPSSYDYAGNPTGVWVYNISAAESLMHADLWVTPVLLGRVYSYPNPYVKPRAVNKLVITYVPSDSTEFIGKYPEIKVTIFNLAGERIRILDLQGSEVDRYSRRAFWDLKNEKDQNVTSGMYFYLIESFGEKVERNKGRLTIVR
jgi:immune inhibitor A